MNWAKTIILTTSIINRLGTVQALSTITAVYVVPTASQKTDTPIGSNTASIGGSKGAQRTNSHGPFASPSSIFVVSTTTSQATSPIPTTIEIDTTGSASSPAPSSSAGLGESEVEAQLKAGAESSKGTSTSSHTAFLAAGISVAFVAIVTTFIFCLYRSRRRRSKTTSLGSSQSQERPRSKGSLISSEEYEKTPETPSFKTKFASAFRPKGVRSRTPERRPFPGRNIEPYPGT
ncbi:hypothetical protein B0O99DRAFT_687921 [Bisporella sp. PMI_857]|nr:hypothetical protein B0O99DRAFT_687921 [Bisporella sp. PMI_857]